jgi:hypothetical protein
VLANEEESIYGPTDHRIVQPDLDKSRPLAVSNTETVNSQILLAHEPLPDIVSELRDRCLPEGARQKFIAGKGNLGLTAGFWDGENDLNLCVETARRRKMARVRDHVVSGAVKFSSCSETKFLSLDLSIRQHSRRMHGQEI